MGNMTEYLGDGAPSEREPGSLGGPGIDLRQPRGGSRKDGPLLEGPTRKTRSDAGRPRIVHRDGCKCAACAATPTQATDLLGRLLADGLITRTASGDYHLRSYGRDALVALRLIDYQESKP